jgi:hypothetical protein
MYLMKLLSGWVIATSTKEMYKHLLRQHREDWCKCWFEENLDRAIELCDEVIE